MDLVSDNPQTKKMMVMMVSEQNKGHYLISTNSVNQLNMLSPLDTGYI